MSIKYLDCTLLSTCSITTSRGIHVAYLFLFLLLMFGCRMPFSILAPWLGEVIGSRAHNKSLNSAFSPFLCQMGGVYRLVGQQKAKGMWVGEKITWVDVRFVQLACQDSVANSCIDVQELTFYFGPYLVALWGLKERERDPFWGPLFVVLERS